MTQTTTDALRQSWKRTIGLLADTIRGFTPETWTKGFTWFQMPAKVSYHTVECIDFYFKPKGSAFTWGSHFGKPYWELPDDGQPSQVDLLTWLAELAVRVEQQLADVADEALGKEYDPTLEDGNNAVEWYVYALRHTVHHHGSLVALADILGTPSGDWDTWAAVK
ncbi:MAG: DinB family protein [Anaerolineae bacterium]|nr:DinB family protein [Anaerolineae bacterium]